MTTDIRNLALQLRAWSEPIASGYEVPAAARTLHAAADALEAMAGEVERLKAHSDAVAKTSALGFSEFERVKAERDRLKAALDQAGDAICDVFEQMAKGSWQDDMGHLVMNNTAMLQLKDVLAAIIARKALGGGE